MNQINFDLLKVELLSKPAEALIPCNLSDFWLDALSLKFDATIEGNEEEIQKHQAATISLAVILHILCEKQGIINDDGTISGSIPEVTLFENMQSYKMELSIEEINRKTDMKCTSATLETIFTNRVCQFSSAEA